MNGRQWVSTSSSTDTQETERERKRPALFHVETPALWGSLHSTHTFTHTTFILAFLMRPYRGHIWTTTLISERVFFFCLCWPSVCCVKSERSHALRHAGHDVVGMSAIIDILLICHVRMMAINLHKWMVKDKSKRGLPFTPDRRGGYRKACSQPSQGKHYIVKKKKHRFNCASL